MSLQSIDTQSRPTALLSRTPIKTASGTLWCLLAIAGFSLTLPATRAAVPELGALFVGAARAVFAGSIAACVLWTQRERFPRAHLFQLSLVGLGVVLGFPLASALGLRSVPATHATMVVGLVPLATALYAMATMGERPSWGFWLTSCVGVLAVMLLGRSHASVGLSAADVWLLVAVGAAAVGYTEGARLAQVLGGLRVISWALVLTLPVSTCLTWFCWPRHSLLEASPTALVSLSYVSVVSMYGAMIAWYRGLAQGSVARASQLQLLQPLLSLFWSWLLLKETVSLATLLAALLVISCVLGSRYARVVAKAPESMLQSGTVAPLTRL